MRKIAIVFVLLLIVISSNSAYSHSGVLTRMDAIMTEGLAPIIVIN